MILEIKCRNMKSNVLIEIDGVFKTVKRLNDGWFYTELNTNCCKHCIKVFQDNILYHNKCYLQLLNPIKFIHRVLFFKNFLYSTNYNAEADVLLMEVKIKDNISKIELELIPQQLNNNYTQYYDSFIITSGKGIIIQKQCHSNPPKRVFINYCLLNYIPPIITIILLCSSFFILKFNVDLLIVLLIYSIYAIINIITDFINQKKLIKDNHQSQ